MVIIKAVLEQYHVLRTQSVAVRQKSASESSQSGLSAIVPPAGLVRSWGLSIIFHTGRSENTACMRR